MSQDEIDTRKAAEEIAMGCLAGRVRLLNRVITSAYNEALRPHGVRVEQLGLLSMVFFLDRPTPSQMEQFLRIERSTLSRNLKRMRDNGWIENLPGPDARSHCLCVTEKGKRLMRQALQSWRGAQKRLGEELGEETLQALFAVASRLTGDDDAPQRREGGGGEESGR
ncbi:MAG TPA: MarR family winged helix-turn-helix transcriptional regulator [Acidobacteriota bacterium]|nr:MarR family winged helix-turn-helix transcriptional regulator [Acidobacteriota bacterium]